MYGEAGIKKWVEKAAGKDYKFCPKLYQGITHRGHLKGKQFITNEFFRGIVAFEQYLGPVFMQVSDTFSPNRKEELYFFIHTHDEATSPDLTVYLVDKINEAMHLTLTKPVFVLQQNTLF